KKVLRPVQKRALVIEINAWYEIGLQRACGLMMLEHSSFYYRSHARDHRGLSMRIRVGHDTDSVWVSALNGALEAGRLAGGEETRLPALP
ncbi:MAG TPA: hypothetical protein VFO40_03775, partial [Chthoniobacterales bacterium]|nr:hypothetical protein [Chthoniobacterales bacterium]